jgi:hypothetical protein
VNAVACLPPVQQNSGQSRSRLRPHYAGVSDLAHTVDTIVVDEIESWQAVFGGKHITAPV